MKRESINNEQTFELKLTTEHALYPAISHGSKSRKRNKSELQQSENLGVGQVGDCN